MGRGLNFLSSYTWSKSIDYQSAAHGSAQPGEGIQNGLDFAADRADSDFDLRHNFVFSGIYDLPFGEGKRFSSRQQRNQPLPPHRMENRWHSELAHRFPVQSLCAVR